MHPRTFLAIQITALWFAVAILASVTGLVLATASIPSTGCNSPYINRNFSTFGITNTDPQNCDLWKKIASFIHQNPSYSQSTHIIIVQLIATGCLAAFRPTLLAMEWAKLESHTSSTLITFQNGIELIQAPGLVTTFFYTIATKSFSAQTLFVFLVALLSLLSPIAVSPIYRFHNGPFLTNVTLVVGGGVGPDTASSLSVGNIVPAGVVAGRALVNSGRAAMSKVPMFTFNVSTAPFIARDAVQAIWSAEVSTAVAYNSLDCGPIAPVSRLLPSGGDIVSFDSEAYFSGNSTSPSFAGQILGYITTNPQVAAVYLNSTVTDAPGVVSASTTVIFLAANGTLEGAQQTFTPTSPSRIEILDVLICTSSTKLVLSKCTITRGNVTSCIPIPSSDLLPRAPESPEASMEKYIHNPKSVAAILAASPVTAYYPLDDRLPAYEYITKDLIASGAPPLSYLTTQTEAPRYHIPYTYIRDTLFGQTAHALVQGMIPQYPLDITQEVFISTTFATSNTPLLYIVLLICTCCALASTLASTLPSSSRRATAMDAARLLAISRNPKLDKHFERYADRDVEIVEELLNSRVCYVWVEALGRRVLVLGRDNNENHGDEEKNEVRRALTI